MFRIIRQIWMTAINNFRGWWKNPKVIISFCLGFIICFLLSDKVLMFSQKNDTSLQALEPFIWTFGDSGSIMLISLPLLLLFSDMPDMNNHVPFFLIRINRKTWMLGQILYMVMATFFFMVFVLVSTCVLAQNKTYTADMWSNTAAILGYSDIGQEIAVPSFVKVLELSFPYECTLHIFGLMIGYSVLLSGIVLLLNLFKKNAGMIGGITFSGALMIVTPEVIAKWFDISPMRMNIANIIFGWISPLNHATYYMHNFGYDNLPELWFSYLFFGLCSVVIFGIAVLRIRKYPFAFTGTTR